MNPVRQQFQHRPDRGQHGDCHRAALASLFEIDLSEVPHFAHDGPSTHTFSARVSAWLAERNLSSVNFPLQGSLREVLSGVSNSCPYGYWLLTGSARAGGDHMVVCRGPQIVHDPGLGLRGLSGPCSDGYWWASFLTPIDPKAMMRQIGWPRSTPRPWWRRMLGI